MSNIVHVIGAVPYGGVETNLVRVLPRLANHDVRVVTLREKGDLAPQLEAAGVPVDLVYQRTRYCPLSLWRLRNYFKRHGTEIVHCHMRRANTSGRIAAILAGVPVRIATEHDMRLDKNWRHDLVDRLLARHGDVVLGVTEAVCEINRAHSGIPAEKFRVMYLGLELDRLAQQPSREAARATLGLPPGKPVLGFLGRLHAIKNVPNMIRAMNEPGLENAVLAVVGDGPERGSCERLADELGLRDRVVFPGYRDDLPTVFAAFDAMLMASDSEGTATVQMEALAAGTPVITTEVGFCAEALAAGEDYIRIPSPAPAGIAAACREALDPARREELKRRGLARIADFGIEAQVAFLDTLYRELAAAHGLA